MALNDGSGLSEELQNKMMKLGMVSDALTAQWTKGSKVDRLRQIAEQNLTEQLKDRLKLDQKSAEQAAKEFIQAEKRASYEQQRAQAMADAAKKAVAGFQNLASGAMSAAQSAVTSAEVYSGASSTLQLMGNAVKTVTDIIATAVSGIPIIGGFLAAADKTLGAVTDLGIQVLQMQLEFAQRYFNSYQQLSKAGASFGGSLGDAQKAAESVGLSLERYTKFVSENVEALTSFGGGITNASKIVGDMGRNARKADQALLVTYGTQEDINGALSGYTQIMAGYGVDIAKNQKALTAGSVDYLWRLKELTELTGISADRYKKEAAERQNNVMFQRRMQEVQAQFVSRYGEEEGVKRFGQYQNQLNEQLSIIGEKQGPEVAKAVMDAFARGGTGQVIDADTIALFANSPAIRALADGVIKMGSNLTVGKEADVEFAKLEQRSINELVAIKGALENFPGLTKWGDAISLATAKAIGNQAWAKNLDKTMAELADRRKQKKDDLGYGKAYDEKVSLEITQNKITADNLKNMGSLAAAMYEIQKKLVENFGDFSAAVVNFGKFVDKLIEDSPAGKANKRYKEEMEKREKEVTRNAKNLTQSVASNILDHIKNNQAKKSMLSNYGGEEYVQAMAKDNNAAGVKPNLTGYSGDAKASFPDLKIKEGKDGAMASGKKFDTRVSDLMSSFVSSGIGSKWKDQIMITGLNDEYHEGTGSKHDLGQAIDFTVGKDLSVPDAKQILAGLKAAGFSYVRDEYHDKSDSANGNHIHAQLAQGAIVDPTSGGRTVKVGEAGRPEGVFPIDDKHPVPMKLEERQFSELVRILRDHKDISENLLSNS